MQLSYLRKKLDFYLDKQFTKMILPLVLPMAIQNLINVAVSSADIIMLGKVSEISLAATTLANQIGFILILICFGIASGASILTAQYWGKKNFNIIEQIFGIATKIALIISIIFFSLSYFIPYTMISIFTNDEIIKIEAVKYLKIISFTYLMCPLSTVYLMLMRSVERVKISTYTYGFSLITNIIINYILIFGKLGFPKMGVVGAAIGTLIARLLELLISVIYNHKNSNFIQLKLKYIIHNNKILKRDFYKYSIPVILNELLWSISISITLMIIGRLGSSFIASSSITNVVRQFTMIISFGIANATGIILGKTIGEKQYDLALNYSKKFLAFVIIASFIGSFLIFLLSPLIIKFFAINSNIAFYLKFMLKITMFYVILHGFSTTMIVGVFRAGGDTKFALIADVVPAYCGSLVLASIVAFYFRLDSKIVFILLCLDEVLKQPLIIYRYKTKKWLKNITREKI